MLPSEPPQWRHGASNGLFDPQGYIETPIPLAPVAVPLSATSPREAYIPVLEAYASYPCLPPNRIFAAQSDLTKLGRLNDRIVPVSPSPSLG